MTWLAFFQALIGALPELLRLLDGIRQRADMAEQQGIGRQLAVSQALLQQAEELSQANAAKQDAEKKHQTDPTDDAFDPEFKRKD